MSNPFKNLSDFEKYIRKQSAKAMSDIRESVYNDFRLTIDDFYDYYHPQVYVRTKQLPKTLQKGEMYGDGDTIYSSVYFDPDVLDYSTRIVPKQFGNASPNNTYHRNSWTYENDKWVFETAMNYGYVHGGWKGAPKKPPIWWRGLLNIDDIYDTFYHNLDSYIGVKKG